MKNFSSSGCKKKLIIFRILKSRIFDMRFLIFILKFIRSMQEKLIGKLVKILKNKIFEIYFEFLVYMKKNWKA